MPLHEKPRGLADSAGPAGSASLPVQAGPASYYDVLDVSPDATQEEVKHAFKRRALAGACRHPDKGGTGEAFRALVSAFEELHDPVRRSIYNLKLALAAATESQPTRQSTSGDTRNAKRRRLSSTLPEAKLHFLLAKLPTASRAAVYEELSEAQASALEAWQLAHRDEIASSSGAHTNNEEHNADGNGQAADTPGDRLRAVPKGIIAAGSAYRAAANSENITVSGTVADLDVALGDLVLLTSIKQAVQADSESTLGVRLRKAVLHETEQKIDSQLGFTYVFRIKPSCWAGPKKTFNTPTFRKLEDVVRWLERFAPHCVHATGASGGHIWRLSFEEVQQEWEAFKRAYAEVWAEAGDTARARELEKQEENHREQLFSKWEAQRKRLEDIATREREAREGAVKQARSVIANWSEAPPAKRSAKQALNEGGAASRSCQQAAQHHRAKEVARPSRCKP